MVVINLNTVKYTHVKVKILLLDKLNLNLYTKQQNKLYRFLPKQRIVALLVRI